MEQMEQDYTREDIDHAITLAFLNIINCLKYRQTFNNQSISNFKRANPAEALILNVTLGDIVEREEWIRNLLNYRNTSMNHAIHDIAAEAEGLLQNNQVQQPQQPGLLARMWSRISLRPRQPAATIQPTPRDNIVEDFDNPQRNHIEPQQQIIQTPRAIPQQLEVEVPHELEPQLYREVVHTPQPIQQIEIEVPQEHNQQQHDIVMVSPRPQLQTPRPMVNINQQREIPHIVKNTRVQNNIASNNGNRNVMPIQNNYNDTLDTLNQTNIIPIETMMQQEMWNTLRALSTSIAEQRPLNIDKLKNSKQNVVVWFETFDRQTVKWTYQNKGKEVTMWLAENALYHWEMIPEQLKYDYTSVRTHLIDKLRPTDQNFKIKQDFYSAKQRLDESVEQFAHRIYAFKKLCMHSLEFEF
jgi:hypothetical protein